MIALPSDPDPGGGSPIPIPIGYDGDLDGWTVTTDCNDDDPLVNPAAIEIANGLDDNCNGAVDEGFDTTLDSPTVTLIKTVYPDVRGNALGEHVSTEKPPRLVWTGEEFLVFWIDVRDRLRLTRFGQNGELDFAPVTASTPVNAMDVVWTGRHFGIVYEDGRVAGSPSVHLMILDKKLRLEENVVIAELGSEPKIAWGQDRFGIVWNSRSSVNSIRFRRFGIDGYPIAAEEALETSGSRPSIAYDGSIVVPQPDGTTVRHDGRFGIAYEAKYAWAVTGDVLLKAFPRVAETEDPIGPVRVNQHNDSWSCIGQMPSISANQSGFLVAWHAKSKGKDMAQARYFSHDRLAAVQEFVPDADAARYGRLAWTGSEFVMGNDNMTNSAGTRYDVHLRRFDATGNTHVTSPQGAWTEVNMRNYVRGHASVHPDLAIAGDTVGMIWVERDTTLNGTAGWLVFSTFAHK